VTPVLVYSLLVLLLSPLPATWADDAVAPAAPAGAGPPQPQILDLGGGRFRIGSVEVDKPQRTFTVPGRLNLREGPLEYLAAVRHGYKLYETLVELDCDAYEFNVACLLIGLDRANGSLPKMHFDPQPVKGDPVQVTIEWQQDGATKQMSAEQLIKGFDKVPNVAQGSWVYTGSTILKDGTYLAQHAGPVIGFVHDPAPIIEHSVGVGQGGYGVMSPATDLLPAKGTPMRVRVQAIAK